MNILFQNRDNKVELAFNYDEDNQLPSHGDAHLTISINSNGFAGMNEVWVLAAVAQGFLDNLIALEKNRQGEAVLSSISPEELELKVYAMNERGHIAICGKTGYAVHSSEAVFNHSVEFGFELEPNQLEQVVALIAR